MVMGWFLSSRCVQDRMWALQSSSLVRKLASCSDSYCSTPEKSEEERKPSLTQERNSLNSLRGEFAH